MRRTILVAYATKHGSTREVAEAVAEELRADGHDVETLPAALVDGLAPYDGLVLGGSLYMGRWHADARRLLARRREEAPALPLAVFALGPLTTSEADIASARKQLDRPLARAGGDEPLAVGVFGGVVDPERLRFPFNRMPAGDARDWNTIRAWARGVSGELGYGKAAPDPGLDRSEVPQAHR